MNRRFFLQSLGYVSLANMLSSCGASSGRQVTVQILRRSLPIQLLNQAKRALVPKTPVQISTSHNIAELYGRLQRWDQSQGPFQGLNMCGLGDYWLTQAIQSDLIQPLDLPDSALHKLPQRWLELVLRNAQGDQDPSGKIWGAPYRWGATVLVYRKDKFKQLGWDLKDWSDLWNPELFQHVGLLNQPREVMGMTLKTLEQSYNDPNPSQQPHLPEKLRRLHQQTRLYSSRNYIEPLMLGDIWVAMGWSSDVIPALSQDPNLGFVVPASGTAIWADLWVKAKNSATDSIDFPANKLTRQWIEYWWSERVAQDIEMFTNAASVISMQNPSDEKTTQLTQADLSRSEFLLPLSPNAIEQYRQLWLEMRAT